MYDKTGMLICTIFGGWFGLHKFMKKETGMGILYLLTFGLFGIGWIIDIVIVAVSKQPKKVVVKQSDRVCLNCGANIFTDDNFCPNCGADLNMMMLYGSSYKDLVPLSEYADAYTSRKATKLARSYVVFDTETTGLEPSIDNIIELSAIKYVDNKKVASFSMLVNPKRQIDLVITQITGITNHELEDKPTVDKALEYFFNFIEDYTLVAHNAKFDMKMLACECYRNGIEMPDNKVIDAFTLAKRIIPRGTIPNYKLETIKRYLGLNVESHRALDDCITCAKVYQLYLEANQKKKIVIVDEDTGEVLEELN